MNPEGSEDCPLCGGTGMMCLLCNGRGYVNDPRAVKEMGDYNGK